MNSSDTAKKGFKTFILTLSVSLVVFSVIYYFLSSFPTDQEQARVAGKETVATDVKGAKTQVTSPFNDINSKKGNVQIKEVLAAGDTAAPTGTTGTTGTTTPQGSSSVPATGAEEITLGLLLSFVLMGFSAYSFYKNPRVLALRSFEKKASR